MERKKFGDLGRKARVARIEELAKHFNAPEINLDCEVGSGDLWELWHAVYCMPRIAARIFFPHSPDRPRHYVAITSWLGAYASNKATAMDCRLRGDSQAATCYETICEQIYDRLPEGVRW